MKTKIVLLFILLSCQFNSFGQILTTDVVAESGPFFKYSKGILVPRWSHIVGVDTEGGYYRAFYVKHPNLFNPLGKIALEHYNKDFQLLSKTNLFSKEEPLVHFEHLHIYKDQAYLLSRFNNPISKRIELRVQKLSENGELSNTQLIQDQDILQIGYGMGSSYHKSFLKTKLLILENKASNYANLVASKKIKESFNLIMLDAANEMKELWRQSIELPYNTNFFDLLEVTVDDEGNCYLLGILYGSQYKIRTDKEEKPNYEYKILKYNTDGLIFESTLKMQDKFVKDLKIDIVNGKLVAAGFYSSKVLQHTTSGSLYLSLDIQTGAILKESYKDFDFDMLVENITDKAAAKLQNRAQKDKEIIIYDYYIQKIIPRSDGGVSIIAEEHRQSQMYNYVETSINSADFSYNAYSKNSSTYSYGNIMVINIDPSGEIIWSKEIVKKQYIAISSSAQSNEGILNKNKISNLSFSPFSQRIKFHNVSVKNYPSLFSSFTLINSGQELHFIFNDHIFNSPDQEPQKYKYYTGKPRTSIVSIVSINVHGIMERKQLFQTVDNAILAPRIYLQNSSNSVFLKAVHEREDKVVKLTVHKIE